MSEMRTRERVVTLAKMVDDCRQVKRWVALGQLSRRRLEQPLLGRTLSKAKSARGAGTSLRDVVWKALCREGEPTGTTRRLASGSWPPGRTSGRRGLGQSAPSDRRLGLSDESSLSSSGRASEAGRRSILERVSEREAEEGSEATSTSRIK